MIFSLKMEGPGKLYLVPIRSGRSDNVSLTFTMAAKGGRPVDPTWQFFCQGQQGLPNLIGSWLPQI